MTRLRKTQRKAKNESFFEISFYFGVHRKRWPFSRSKAFYESWRKKSNFNKHFYFKHYLNLYYLMGCPIQVDKSNEQGQKRNDFLRNPADRRH